MSSGRRHLKQHVPESRKETLETAELSSVSAAIYNPQRRNPVRFGSVPVALTAAKLHKHIPSFYFEAQR